jgi:hypothetical protein
MGPHRPRKDKETFEARIGPEAWPMITPLDSMIFAIQMPSIAVAVIGLYTPRGAGPFTVHST